MTGSLSSPGIVACAWQQQHFGKSLTQNRTFVPAYRPCNREVGRLDFRNAHRERKASDMNGNGLGFFYRAILHVLGIVGVLILGACSSLPQLPEIPGLKTSSPSDSSRTEQQAGTTLMTRGPKKRIAVMPFDVKARNTYGYQQVELTAAEMLTTALAKTGEFIVVERAVLDKVLKEQSLGLAGFVDPSTAA